MAVAALSALLLGGTARGQCPPVLGEAPWTPRLDGAVNAIASSSLGTVIAGEFSYCGDTLLNHVGFVAPGSLSAPMALGSGVNGVVRAAVLLANGDVVVGGDFDTAGGVPAAHVAWYHQSTGAWTDLNGGTNGPVMALAVYTDGSLIVGGAFSGAGTVQANNVARFTPSTGAWSRLAGGVTGGANVSVRALGVVPGGGSVFVGGEFAQADGIAAANIARYLPSVDAWASVAGGTNGRVNAVLVQSQRVFFGGAFTSAGGLANTNHVAIVTTSGSGLRAFLTGIPYEVITFSQTDGDQSLVGTVGGHGDGSSLFRLATSPFNGQPQSVTQIAGGPSGVVRAIGHGWIGGDFGSVGGDPVLGYLASVPTSGPGSSWRPAFAFGAGRSEVRCLTPLSAGGGAWAAGASPSGSRNRVSSVTASVSGTPGVPRLSEWTGDDIGVVGEINAMTPDGDDGVIAGGAFSLPGAAGETSVARFDRWTSTWQALGAGVQGEVFGLARLANADVVAVGEFAAAGGVPAMNVARFDRADGGWHALGAGLDQRALCAALAANGDLVTGGEFANAGGAPAAGIARYSFVSQAWSPLGTGVDGDVLAIAALPNGDVLVGGTFLNAGGVPAAHIAWYHHDSDTWTPMGAGLPADVQSIALDSAGDVVAGGSFEGSLGHYAVARYSVSTGQWEPIGLGIRGTVLAILAQPNGDLFVGGKDVSASGIPTSRLYGIFTGRPIWLSGTGSTLQLCPTHNATLEVYVASPPANGTARYLWRKDGVALDPSLYASVTGPTLTLGNVEPRATGAYDCVLSNDCGGWVLPPIAVTVPEASDPVCEGSACMADFNHDGVVDQGDVDYLINSIAGEGDIDTDFNHDGVGDQGDVDAMINFVAGGGCP